MRRRWVRDLIRDPFVAIAAAAVLLPTIAAALSALHRPWMPSGDWALIELQVRDVGTSDTPLVGVYSRYGWRHPGPWPFYLLALPYRLVPADRGLLFAAAVVNGAAVLGFILLMLRRSRLQALVGLIGLAVLQRGMGIKELGDPWNPTLPVMPFALFLAVCFEHATTKKRWTFPAGVALGSFVVQSHVGFAHPAFFVGAAACGYRWWQTRREREAAELHDVAAAADAAGAPEAQAADVAPATAEISLGRRLLRSPVAWTVGVLALAWTPPLWDQVAGRGNLGELVRWSLGDDSQATNLTTGRPGGVHTSDWAAWLLDPTGLWIGNFRPLVWYGVPLFGQEPMWKLLWLPIVLGATVAIVRWQRGKGEADEDGGWRRHSLALSTLGAAGTVATITGLLTVRGVPVFHPFRWVAAVVMVLWIALAWAIVGAVKERVPWIEGQTSERSDRLRSRILAGVMVVAVVVPVVFAVWGGTLGRRPGERDLHTALLRLRAPIEEAARKEAEDILVVESDNGFNIETLGLAVIIDRAGIPWVEPDDPRALGHRRLDVTGAYKLDGLLGVAVEMGNAEVVAMSGSPQEDEESSSELVLMLSGPLEDLRPTEEGTLD